MRLVHCLSAASNYIHSADAGGFPCFPQTHQRYDVRRLGGKPMRQLFVVGY